MAVIEAAWIKLCFARRALTRAFHVLIDSQFPPTASAKHRLNLPLAAGPDLKRVTSQSGVTIFTGVVDAATFRLDSYDIPRRAVMSAARLRVQTDPAHAWRSLHTS